MPGLFWLMSLSVLAITPREISTQLCPDANSARKLRYFIPLFGTKSNLYHYEKNILFDSGNCCTDYIQFM
jgi:hypothetical protein